MENDDAVARGLLYAMKTYRFVATLYFLCDVVPILTTLSLMFQKENVSLTAILPSVNATISSLNLLKNQPGPNLQKVDDVLGVTHYSVWYHCNRNRKKGLPGKHTGEIYGCSS